MMICCEQNGNDHRLNPLSLGYGQEIVGHRIYGFGGSELSMCHSAGSLNDIHRLLSVRYILELVLCVCRKLQKNAENLPREIRL